LLAPRHLYKTPVAKHTCHRTVSRLPRHRRWGLKTAGRRAAAQLRVAPRTPQPAATRSPGCGLEMQVQAARRAMHGSQPWLTPKILHRDAQVSDDLLAGLCAGAREHRRRSRAIRNVVTFSVASVVPGQLHRRSRSLWSVEGVESRESDGERCGRPRATGCVTTPSRLATPRKRQRAAVRRSPLN
jgi:hypothetical protein